MSFRRYLRENRGQFVDHRDLPPPGPGVPLDGPLLDEPPPDLPVRRVGRRRGAAAQVRFRHVKPAFTPSAFSDPLPYEEPWQRAFR